jgi:hypothetical protein
MVDDTARDQAICQALKAADEIAAALQAHLIEEHGADPDRSADRTLGDRLADAAAPGAERLGSGLRAIQASSIEVPDGAGMMMRR